MTITRGLLLVALLAASAACDRLKPPEPTAKNDMAGKIVFSTSAFDDAKKLVARPAGVEFEKYPLKFAIPAYFGARPQPGTSATVNSGSASLLRLGGQLFALTCSHVLEGYRQRFAEGPCIFQLGDCEFDPLAQLKSEDEELDYALIVVTEGQGKEIAKPGGPFDGTFFCEPSQSVATG